MDRRSVKILVHTFYTALIAWFLISFAFRNWPWGANLAVCVGYTILAAGVIYADKDSRVFSPKTRGPFVLIALQHACFLIVAIVLFHAVMYVEPTLEAASSLQFQWFFAVPVATMWGLAYGEKWVLSRDRKQDSGADDEDALVDSSSAERDQDR